MSRYTTIILLVVRTLVLINPYIERGLIAGKSIVIYDMTWEALSPSLFTFTLSGLSLLKLNYAALYPIAKRIWDCFS